MMDKELIIARLRNKSVSTKLNASFLVRPENSHENNHYSEENLLCDELSEIIS